ncbi:MAG: zinc ABC transporter substrate-binding protein, partial [Alistipes sp.]|nr:zinc ABC transporter substrate-binding protein [Alistipes sp.]
AQWIFHTGLIDFEQSLLTKIDHQEKLANLHEGIELLAGSCSHHHSHKHPHHHGIDPHIWTSPRALQQMAATMYATIHAAYPDSVRYTANYERLQAQLIALDQRTEEQIAESGIRSFVVYHPALTYYARDYGLTQEAIEQEGKEPSARQLAALIRKARSEGVRTILYQRQFPRSSVETLAADIDAQAIEFDPLAEDIVSQIDSITSWITRR